MSRFLILISLLFSFFLLLPLPAKAADLSQATIIDIQQEASSQEITLKITKGPLLDSSPLVINTSQKLGDYEYKVNQRVLVSSQTNPLSGEIEYRIEDYLRSDALLLLTLIFLVVTIFVAKIYGLTSLLGMVLSFFVIFKFTLPNILAGRDPVLFTVISSLFILPPTFYLSHGLNKKTSLALISTIISIILTGLLALLFSNLAYLQGTASEESAFVASLFDYQINLKNLLLSGIIIGSMGILDDVAISQVAIVKQLSETIAKPSFSQLYTRAMAVGRDHVSSMINTLILVYAGSSLPLLILFSSSSLSFSELINYQIIAEEIVKTLVGSISLMLCVPLSTILAARNYSHKKD